MSRRVRRCFLTVIGLVAIGITACNRQQVSGWKKLAEFRDSSGNRYVVAQQHYAWVEGWRISFSLVGADRKIYGSILEMESSLPWRKVRIVQNSNLVEVLRADQLIGVFDTSTRIFTNHLNRSVDKYVEGFNDVQGKSITTNLYFDSQ